MTRRLTPDSASVTARLPPATLAALDAEVARLRAGGVRATRSDVVRVALAAWATADALPRALAVTPPVARPWWRRAVEAAR